MKAIDICGHFFSKADWVDPDDTVDGVIAGDGEKDIQRVMVTWISSFDAIRRAVEGGFDAMITHEPTFYNHRSETLNIEDTETGAAKLRLITESGLVVLRNHDVWDAFPQVGIPSAWGRFLQLGEPIEIGDNGYLHRYEIEPTTLDEFAARVAGRTAEIGEPAVQVVGDGGKVVRQIGVGTGCICSPMKMKQMGCDLSIVCDDGPDYWKAIQWAADSEYPIVRVNHGTSEEPGMVSLTKYVNDHLPGVTAEHLPHGACFRLVGAL